MTTFDTCFILHEIYFSLMMEEYHKVVLKVANVELFLRVNERKLLKGYWYFTNDMVYQRVIPITLYQQLNLSQRFRLAEGTFNDCETFEFRLLMYITWNKEVNGNDVFVMIGKRDIPGIVQFLVRNRFSTSTLQNVSSFLAEDYQSLKVKCQTYRNFLNASQGLFQQDETL